MIKYGIDSFILSAPWSLVVSVLMFSGVSVLGFFVLKYSRYLKIINKISDPLFQLPIFGLLTLLIILFPLILFNLLSVFFLKSVSLFLLLLNLYYLRNYKVLFNKILKIKTTSFNIDYLLSILLILGYFLLSLLPITSADSLDYHSSTAIYIANYAIYPLQLFDFHSRTAGSGELLIALGFLVGAEQFGSLTQFSGLLSILGLIIKLCKDKNYYRKCIIFFILIFLTIPILIFFNSTNKPQLFPIALTSISYVLIFFKFDLLNKKEKNLSYFLICILLIQSFLLKYSFILSVLIIGLYALYKVVDKKNFLHILKFSFLIFIFTYFPYFLWKYLNFDKNFFYALFLALPEHLYGYSSLMLSISSCGYYCTPTWFFLPRSISEGTNFFGVLFLFLFFLKIKDKKHLLILFTIILYIIIGLNFGQSNPRFFFEPAIWWLFLLISSSYFFDKKLYKYFFKHLVRLKAALIIFIIYYTIFNIMPASLLNQIRSEILNKNANGYQFFDWVNNNLNSHDVILSAHRSVSIPKIKTLPLFFINYINPKDERAKIYFLEIKKERPEYIVFTGNSNEVEKYKKIFGLCFGELAFFKENVSKIATRNPLSSFLNEDGYIFRFEYRNLPECLTN
jgi:hypothetical protein